jgi:hypothetical protein
MKEPALACVLNGLSCGGDIMRLENQRSGVVLLNEMSREELSKALVALIKNDRQVRMAIINLALASPYIVRQY